MYTHTRRVFEQVLLVFQHRLEQHVACLDYSVARPGGKLVAYQWCGERELRKESFVVVNRVEL